MESISTQWNQLPLNRVNYHLSESITSQWSQLFGVKLFYNVYLYQWTSRLACISMHQFHRVVFCFVLFPENITSLRFDHFCAISDCIIFSSPILCLAMIVNLFRIFLTTYFPKALLWVLIKSLRSKIAWYFLTGWRSSSLIVALILSTILYIYLWLDVLTCISRTCLAPSYFLEFDIQIYKFFLSYPWNNLKGKINLGKISIS